MARGRACASAQADAKDERAYCSAAQLLRDKGAALSLEDANGLDGAEFSKVAREDLSHHLLGGQIADPPDVEGLTFLVPGARAAHVIAPTRVPVAPEDVMLSF